VRFIVTSAGTSSVPSKRYVQAPTARPIRQTDVVKTRLNSALKGKVFPLDVGAHLEVVNERVRDDGKQSRRHCFVRGMVEICAQAIDVVEFKDRCVGEIETRE